MIVLDTTVLVYAVGTEHQFREPCRRLIDAVAQGAVRATTTVEVIQEFAHVRARRRDRVDAQRLAHAYTDLLAPLLVVDEQALRAGLDMFADSADLGSFDAVLAAAARAVGASALVSVDRAFGEIAEVKHVMPTEAGVTGLITPG